MKTLDITNGFFQETTLSASESKRKNIVIICVFICRNFCNSQLIAIQPLYFSQILSKKEKKNPVVYFRLDMSTNFAYYCN